MKQLEFGNRFSEETVDGEDEWCDFTEENRIHYTSLRRSIQMSLSSTILAPFSVGEVKVKESEQRDTGGDGIDVGQGHDDGMSNTCCPWQKLESHFLEAPKYQMAPRDQKDEMEPEKQENLIEIKRQVYIPPALRQSQGDFNRRHQAENRLRNTNTPTKMSGKPQAPDLNSPEYFPSLTGSKICKRTK